MATATTTTRAAERPARTNKLQTKLLIDGKWVEATSGKTFETLNPATGEVIARVAEADKADVDRATASARRAFDAGVWPQTAAAERGRLLYKLADLIEAHKQELAELETLDNGKPIRGINGVSSFFVDS